MPHRVHERGELHYHLEIQALQLDADHVEEAAEEFVCRQATAPNRAPENPGRNELTIEGVREWLHVDAPPAALLLRRKDTPDHVTLQNLLGNC